MGMRGGTEKVTQMDPEISSFYGCTAWSNSLRRKSRNDMNVSCASGEWENIHIKTGEKAWEQPHPIPALDNQEGTTKSQPLPGEGRVWATYITLQSLSHVRLVVVPWTAARQASMSTTNSQTMLKFMSIESVMPSSCLILLLSPSPPAFNFCQHQGLFQGVSSLHQVVKVLELQLQNQSFQWIFRIDFL